MSGQLPDLNRRSVLAWLAGGTVALAGASFYGLARASAAAGTGTQGIVRVGRRYVATVPEESELDLLLSLLPELKEGEELAEHLSSLKDRVAEDFADGKTLLLDGWLLSRTEARAAAVVALTLSP